MSQAFQLESNTGQQPESLPKILWEGLKKRWAFEKRMEHKNLVVFKKQKSPETVQTVKMNWYHFHDNCEQLLTDTCTKISKTGHPLSKPIIETLIFIEWLNTKVDCFLIHEADLADKRRKSIGTAIQPFNN